jgi:hypothetical protein
MTDHANATAHEEWMEALRAEREAYKRISGTFPGSPNYDPLAWKQWQDAVARADLATRRYLSILRPA